MKIEAGKKYIMRGGRLTGVVYINEQSEKYPFDDGVFSWTADGRSISANRESEYDIIGEYVGYDPTDITVSDAIALSSKMFSRALETGDELMYKGAITIAELLKKEWKE